jgi:hypothetical protein
MPILLTCQRIQGELLKAVDLEVYQHLEKIGIEPQLYGMYVLV